MSHFGLSEGFGSLLLIALGVLAAIFLVRMFLSRRQTAAPMQFAGASSNNAIPPSYETQPGPAWSGAEKPEPLMAAEPTAPAFGVARKPLPPGFDADGFAKEAKRQYIQIQRSYDNADRAALSSVMTSEMNAEIGREIDGRGTHQPTEIVTLDADVLEVTTENDKYWVSVRFTGLLREDGEPLAVQLADDALHAHAFHADARAHAIHVFVFRHDRDLGALARFTRYRADHHRAIVNFWHFALK